MKCPWCGREGTAGQCGEGEDPVWRRWYCDWRKGCGMCWEFGDDGTGFYQQLAAGDRSAKPVRFGSCLVVFGEEECLEMGGMMVGGCLVGNAQMGGCMAVTQEERE